MSDDKKFYRAYRDTEYTAGGFVEACLDGSSYDRGELETIKAGTEQGHEALGRLVQILFDKGLLTKSDVYRVANETES